MQLLLCEERFLDFEYLERDLCSKCISFESIEVVYISLLILFLTDNKIRLPPRLLRVPWTARISKQSILKEISPGCSLEGLMLKLKRQYFWPLMRRVDSLEKTLMLGGIGTGGEGDNRGWDGWMTSLTRWTWVWVNSRSWWWTMRPDVLQPMGSQRVGYAEWLKWTEGTS